MAYQKTRYYSNGADLLITGGTIVREIKVPQSVVAKLREPSPYNEALDSTEIVAEKIIEQPVVQGKDPESEFSKPIDVAGPLSGNNAEKVEEPAIPVAQSIDPQTTAVGEPAYGEAAVPVNNVINFPDVRKNQDISQTQTAETAQRSDNVIQFPTSEKEADTESILDSLQRVQEAQELALAVTNQEIAKLTAELAEKNGYQKVA